MRILVVEDDPALLEVLGSGFREHRIDVVTARTFHEGREKAALGTYAVIILDEGQNATVSQMKMFLTRMGMNSKIIVTGDITQIDLPSGQHSGLNVVREILNGIDDLSFVYLSSRDVVRHRIVQDIVEAYRRYDEARA